MGWVVVAGIWTSEASAPRAVSKSWLLHASAWARAMVTAGDSGWADIGVSPLRAGGTPVLLIPTAASGEDWAAGGRPVSVRVVVCTGSAGAGPQGAAVGGWRGDGGIARPGASRRWERVRPACRAVPARAAGVLLPVSGLGGRRRGRAARGLAVGLAGPGRVRGAGIAADLAVPGRHQPVPGCAAVSPPPPAGERATSRDERAGAARADPARGAAVA